MAEVGKAENIKVDNTPEIVAVGDGRIGYVFGKKGQSFHLSGIFGETGRGPKDGKIIRVYFRTEDNIYGLNDQGQLVNFDGAQGNGNFNVKSVNVERLKKEKVVVGERFAFTSAIITGIITEIVAVNSDTRRPKDLDSLTGGKKNSIVEDFTINLPK